ARDDRGPAVPRRLRGRAQPRRAGGAGPGDRPCVTCWRSWRAGGPRPAGVPPLPALPADLERWWPADDPVGMATAVATWRSAPRPPGATMLVGPDGTAVGSVSGGCVESAVYELAQQI